MKFDVANQTIDNILSTADITRPELQELFELHNNISTRYLSCNDVDRAEFNQKWTDLECLRQVPQLFLMIVMEKMNIDFIEIEDDIQESPESGLGCIILSKDPKTLTEAEIADLLQKRPSIAQFNNKFYYIGSNTDWNFAELTNIPKYRIDLIFDGCIADQWHGISSAKLLSTELFRHIPCLQDRYPSSYLIAGNLAHVSFEPTTSLTKLPKFVLDLLHDQSPDKKLQQAIFSGGVRITDLVDITPEDLNIISSEDAIAQYSSYGFIHAADILKNSALDKSNGDRLAAHRPEDESLSSKSSPPIQELSKQLVLNYKKENFTLRKDGQPDPEFKDGTSKSVPISR
jgi:hypothetical protein